MPPSASTPRRRTDADDTGVADTAHRAVRIPAQCRRLSVSPAVAYAIRFGVATSAAIWIGKVPGLVENHSTWILITVLMVLQPTNAGSVLKGLLRAVGTIAAAFTAILLFGLFAQDPPLLMAGMFLVQAVAAYGYSGSRFQYAWFVWAFTTAIVLGDAMAGQDAVEVVAFQRASGVGIGILLVMVVDSLLWPVRAEPRSRKNQTARPRVPGTSLRSTISGQLSCLRVDPFRMKVALRTGIAVIAAFVVLLALGWPMNTLVAPIAFMFAALTRGAAVKTVAVLAATVAFGWLVADVLIVYVTPLLGRAPLALTVPFVVAAAFAYFSVGRPRLAMLPSIGGLIALLSAYGGESAATNVYGPYSTVSYIALAVGVGWLFSRSMWPAASPD